MRPLPPHGRVSTFNVTSLNLTWPVLGAFRGFRRHDRDHHRDQALLARYSLGMTVDLESLLKRVAWAVRINWKGQPCLYCAHLDGKRDRIRLDNLTRTPIYHRSDKNRAEADRRYLASAVRASTGLEKTCAVCLQIFVPTRSDQRYCSSACRVAGHRRKP